MNRHIRSLVFFSLIFTGCGGTTEPGNKKKAATPPPQTPTEVLAQWVGTWKGKDYFKRAEWTPKAKSFDVSLKCEWMLGKKFVEERGEGDGTKWFYIVGYDEKKKTYRDWFFASDGTAMQSTGTWNSKTRTMTWTSDMGDGVTAVGTLRFIGEDQQEWAAVARDKNGKVVLDVGGKRSRVK